MMSRRASLLAALILATVASRCAWPGDEVKLVGPPRRPRRVKDVPETIVKKGDLLRLNIPPRKQDPERPPQGWCGENAIQQAMLFHGVYFPQKQINKAGNPKHPDLYARNVPVALKSLRMDIERWPPRPCRFDKFLAWMKGHIKTGCPVLTGVKIYPTRHPNWGLDHFILAVGFGNDSLIYNTTWNRQESRTNKLLFSTRKGLSFRNRYSSYYGIRIVGPAGMGKGAFPVRLFVVRETGDKMDVVVKCERLAPQQEYLVYRLASYGQKTADRPFLFEADGPAYAFRDTIDKKQPAIYRCRGAAAR